jgi:putative hemolysin
MPLKTENLDPNFSDYIQDNPTLSYVQETDPWLVQKFISAIEIMFGRKKIEAIYDDIREKPFTVESFFASALEATRIEGLYEQSRLMELPKSGPLVFLANHPFGVVDGLILCDMAIKARGNFRVLVNAMLCRDRNLAPHFLPIDFEESKQAAKNNIRTKKMAQQCLAENIPLLIFPSGFVSTADRKGFGKVVDAPWTTFAAKLIRDSQATVVPIHFEGQNSRLFHIASHISEPLRMALLLNEASNKFGSQVNVKIGDTITWAELETVGNRQELTRYLYDKVNSLAMLHS